MAKITGIGGVFIYSDDPGKDYQWYEDTLGIKREPDGVGLFRWRDDHEPGRRCMTVWSHINRKSGYFHDSTSNIMINYRVDNLKEMMDELKQKGVEILGTEESEFGTFAWINDDQGIRIELWEPPTDNPDCY